MMSTIGSLNDQYIEAVKSLDTLREYDIRIEAELDGGEKPESLKAVNAVALLSELAGKVDCSVFGLLKDTVRLGNQYIFCLNLIKSYKTLLLQTGQGKDTAVFDAATELGQAQSGYDELKTLFRQKHDFNVDSIKSLNQVILVSVRKALSEAQSTVDQLKREARDIETAENTTELRKTDPVTGNNKLPEEMLVARVRTQNASAQIMRDIGVTGTYKNICVDLRNQGNVMILSGFEHVDDRQIDEFIVAYVLRFLETFPLGMVNVHIFNQNANYIYKRLSNSFQSENAGEQTKKTVQIHTSMSDLESIRDVNCEDIFRKTSVSRPDLYAVYEDDCTDPFNLIILRDGLVDGSGYVSAEVLNTVNSLSKPGEIGHKCGLRFLIVDNSASFEKNLSPHNKHYLTSIQQNCALKLYYDKAGFSIDGVPADVLHFSDDLDEYVQERSKAIADAINSREKSYITLDEISAKENADQIGNIMFIPVGKSGGSIVELPLSCRDEDGTVAGQCIGYIAIGQSGSGKSSFFHSLVLNGCTKYSPKDLQFWLLDFKNGGASSKYSNCGIPHIKIIAENNKIDDALCLFQMVLEEMERRSKAFNRHFTDNIIEYNKKASAEGLEYFPRIIIAIDEVQEIFREDNASVLQKLISSISTRMRSAGMHFVMVAQNLSEGKSYMLKDAFLPSATGRICFRVSQDIPRESGFGDEFIQRKQEIAELKTGEAYVSYGKGTIKKVRMAFVSPQDMNDKVFAEIRGKYTAYSNLRPKVIGSKKRLSVVSSRQGEQGTYQDVFKGLQNRNGIYDAVLGEDVYRMVPFHIRFSQHENSSVLLLGSDKQMSSSLCTSVALSLLKQNARVHLFNGDKVKVSAEYDSFPHPFMFLCQKLVSSNTMMQSHRLDQLKDVLQEMYSEYLSRQAMVQSADDEEPAFPAVVLIINDLFGIESFISNEVVENGASEDTDPDTSPGGFSFNYDIFSDQPSISSRNEGQFREGTQSIIGAIAKNGYRFNLHVVLAIKGEPSTWRTGNPVTGINNKLLYNDTEYADQIQNSYYLKEMLKNISNDGEPETVAVWAGGKTFSKVRPVIYDMSDEQEREALQSLITF